LRWLSQNVELEYIVAEELHTGGISVSELRVEVAIHERCGYYSTTRGVETVADVAEAIWLKVYASSQRFTRDVVPADELLELW
jgi:hypothetical protein